ncbi:MAG TPA: hypothetical protein ACN46R_02425 [Prochlorococcus sp.]
MNRLTSYKSTHLAHYQWPIRPTAAALLLGLVVGCSTQITEETVQAPVVQEFQFQVINHETPRQEGRKVNLFLRYRYRQDLATTEYPDWAKVHTAAPKFLRVRPSQPQDEYWEVLNERLVRDLYSSFPLVGIVSRLQVQPVEHPKSQETKPIIYSSITTLGEVNPIVTPQGFTM